METKPKQSGASPVAERSTGENKIIAELTPIAGASFRPVAKTLARILVGNALEEETNEHPKDSALRLEAARTEIPGISMKRVSKLEVMTAGELARFLEVPIAHLSHHLEVGSGGSLSSRDVRCSRGLPTTASYDPRKTASVSTNETEATDSPRYPIQIRI